MARDARRTKSVTFTEDQTTWIEAQIASGAPDAGTVIKSTVDRAMSGTAPAPQPAVKEAAPVTPVAACSFNSAPLREIAVTLDILLKKYMIDHPGRKLSGTEESELEARWNAIIMLRTNEVE